MQIKIDRQGLFGEKKQTLDGVIFWMNISVASFGEHLESRGTCGYFGNATGAKFDERKKSASWEPSLEKVLFAQLWSS